MKLDRDQFFTQAAPNSLLWKCRCGAQRKDSQRGYKNFIEHVQTKHPEDLSTLLADGQTVSSASECPLKSLFLWEENYPNERLASIRD